jgi:tellurite resistance protein
MDAEQYFTNLALAAMVDGHLDEAERLLLEQHAENLRLSSEQAQGVLNKVFSGELTEFVKPQSPEARKAAFRAVVRILRADKVLTGKEQRMIKMLGHHMEIADQMIDSALGAKWDGGK